MTISELVALLEPECVCGSEEATDYIEKLHEALNVDKTHVAIVVPRIGDAEILEGFKFLAETQRIYASNALKVSKLAQKALLQPEKLEALAEGLKGIAQQAKTSAETFIRLAGEEQ